MIERIRYLLAEVPFQPFYVVTSAGRSYRVASPDHAGVSPSKTKVHIWFDDDGATEIAGLHIVSVDYEATLAPQDF